MMNHIEMALLKKELHRLKEDFVKCDNERLKESIMEDIRLIEEVVNRSESKKGTKVKEDVLYK